ncbi:MAG: hypothetical protein GY714_20760 [Desulfobacterales bacterium]|nr:hypothetical protein [Desulfobacterales bacterium]
MDEYIKKDIPKEIKQEGVCYVSRPKPDELNGTTSCNNFIGKDQLQLGWLDRCPYCGRKLKMIWN